MPLPTPPSMNDDQSQTLDLLVILGVVAVLISPLGQWLAGIVEEIATHHTVNTNFNPFSGKQDTTSMGDTFHAPNISSGNSNGGSSPSLWNVPIIGSNGEPGSIQVVAHDPAGAVENAHQGGNIPAGEASPV